MESSFSQEKRAYYELKINRTKQSVKDKWNHAASLPAYFHCEQIRWRSLLV